MTSRFRPNPMTRLFNGLLIRLIRIGVPMGDLSLLTVAGRRTGHPRTTPVMIGSDADHRWVLSPFGEVDWVRNLRSAGTAEVTRRGRTRTVRAFELTPEEAAPLIRRTLSTAPSFTRRNFVVTADSPIDDIQRAAPDHPVFRLEYRVSR